jgi:hypothetical protein
MTTVLRGQTDRAARLAAEQPASLVVSVGPSVTMGETPKPPAQPAAPGASRDPVAQIGVSVRDEALARRLVDAMATALEAQARPPRVIDVVRVRSRKGLERLGASVAGTIAVVPLTARNLRRAGEIVEALRALGALGVQLVWDGREPPKEVAEARVFAILEQARATPARAPVVLSRGEEPVEALRILVDRRC